MQTPVSRSRSQAVLGGDTARELTRKGRSSRSEYLFCEKGFAAVRPPSRKVSPFVAKNSGSHVSIGMTKPAPSRKHPEPSISWLEEEIASARRSWGSQIGVELEE